MSPPSPAQPCFLFLCRQRAKRRATPRDARQELALGHLGWGGLVLRPRGKKACGAESGLAGHALGLYGVVVGWVVLCNQTTSLFLEPLDQYRRPAPTKVSLDLEIRFKAALLHYVLSWKGAQ